MGAQLRVHRFLARTSAEGPGVRACIWVQGCSIGCPGCAVPNTWRHAGGDVVDVDDLVTSIDREKDLEGVTFVGGEPFEQPRALAEIGMRVRARGLSVVTFSGMYLEDIQEQHDPDCDALLGVTDLLIDGPFIRELPDTTRPWVGSTNQRFHFLTDRYAHFVDCLRTIPNRLEIHVAVNGVVRVNGMAPAKILEALGGPPAMINAIARPVASNSPETSMSCNPVLEDPTAIGEA